MLGLFKQWLRAEIPWKKQWLTRGQILIPSMLRRKFGIKKGTQVYVYERAGEIVIQPITDDYIRNMAGISGTKGRPLKALMAEKAKESSINLTHPFGWAQGSNYDIKYWMGRDEESAEESPND